MEEVNEPILEYNQLDPGGYYNYADYLRWQFEERVELIKGKLLKMSPGPNLRHQETSGNLYFNIKGCFINHPCRLYYAPFDVRLPVQDIKRKRDSTVVQPDLCIICDLAKLDDKGCNGAPDLVVEILSPGNTKHDMHTKFWLYEESGVKEYWMIQPNDRNVLVYSLKDGKYIGLPPFSEGDIIESPLFPEMQIAVSDVFQNVK